MYPQPSRFAKFKNILILFNTILNVKGVKWYPILYPKNIWNMILNWKYPVKSLTEDFLTEELATSLIICFNIDDGTTEGEKKALETVGNKRKFAVFKNYIHFWEYSKIYTWC